MLFNKIAGVALCKQVADLRYAPGATLAYTGVTGNFSLQVNIACLTVI